jgi:hypothetical protein
MLVGEIAERGGWGSPNRAICVVSVSGVGGVRVCISRIFCIGILGLSERELVILGFCGADAAVSETGEAEVVCSVVRLGDDRSVCLRKNKVVRGTRRIG